MTTVQLFCGILMALTVVWGVSLPPRLRSVRGSRERYVWASIEHGARYFALVFFAVAIAFSLVRQDRFQVIVGVAGIALWAYVTTALDRDDDWFSDLRRRLRGLLTRRTPALATVRH